MDMTAVRQAFRSALKAKGHRVGSDSHGIGSELYILNDSDLALALFEFQPTAEEAFGTMYQGSWVDGLPPRFAVMPASEASSPSVETLEQARIVPLFFEMSEGEVRFPDLDAVLSRSLGA